MTIEQLLEQVKQQAEKLVWWSPSQIANGHDKKNDPREGERAWIIPETTGKFLHDFIVDKKPKNILELGTSIGYSTLWMAHATETYGGKVLTIERNPEKVTIAKKNIQDAGLKNVIFHQGQIIDIIKDFPEDLRFDFVFMDADRGHYHEYFPLIKKHLNPGATIMADNAVNMQKRMQPFLQLLEQEKTKYEIKDLDNGILIIYPEQYCNN